MDKLKIFAAWFGALIALGIIFLANESRPERRVIEIPKEVVVHQLVYTEAQRADVDDAVRVATADERGEIEKKIRLGVVARETEIIAACTARADKESLSVGEYIGLKLIGF